MIGRGSSLPINEFMGCLPIISMSLLMDATVGEGDVAPSPCRSTATPQLWLGASGRELGPG